MLTIKRTEKVNIFGQVHTFKYADCGCGMEIVLDDFTNYCDSCSRIYNLDGQQLSNPQTWGEETDEHWTDIVNFSMYD